MDIEDLRKVIREEITTFDTHQTHIDRLEPGTRPESRSEAKPAQSVPAAHTVLPFQKYCTTPGCKNENPTFTKARYRCKNCKGPLATKLEEAPDECIWGCGNKGEGSLEEIE